MTKYDLSPHLVYAALDSVVDGVLITENNGGDFNIIYANAGFTNITGYTAEQVMGRDCRFMSAGLRDQPELDIVRTALKAGKPTSVVLHNRKADGSTFYNELTLSPIVSDDGEITHYIGITKDVSLRILEKQRREQQNVNLEQEVLHLSEEVSRDPLTGLYNRRYFEQQLNKLWSLHQRRKLPLWLVFIDIDDFKLYNDHYGHQKGDEALKKVADAMAKHFSRNSDVVARYGGEEFIVALTQDDEAEQSAVHVEAMRSKIEKLGIEQAPDSRFDCVTISVGVYVGVPPIDSPPSRFVRRADMAMYRAKNLGGNRVRISTDKTSLKLTN